MRALVADRKLFECLRCQDVESQLMEQPAPPSIIPKKSLFPRLLSSLKRISSAGKRKSSSQQIPPVQKDEQPQEVFLFSPDDVSVYFFPTISGSFGDIHHVRLLPLMSSLSSNLRGTGAFEVAFAWDPSLRHVGDHREMRFEVVNER